jgi:hypothetical protein
MAFDLQITITGLCVFVPDPTNHRMHVLMLEPGAHHGPTGRHYPRLFYDANHDSGAKRQTYWRIVPLDRAVLDLSGFATNGTYGGQLSDIPDLVDITGDIPALPNSMQTPMDGLSCRVTLPLATTISSDAKPGWTYGNTPLAQAAWLIKWDVNGVAGDSLPLQLQAFRNENIAAFPRQPLKAKKRGSPKVVRIHLSNVVLNESAPPELLVGLPANLGKMPHFEAYGEFYQKTGQVTNPWPELVYNGPTTRGTPYSCLPSGGK